MKTEGVICRTVRDGQCAGILGKRHGRKRGCYHDVNYRVPVVHANESAVGFLAHPARHAARQHCTVLVLCSFNQRHAAARTFPFMGLRCRVPAALRVVEEGGGVAEPRSVDDHSGAVGKLCGGVHARLVKAL